MRIFLTDIVILCIALWLIANLLRYVFHKEEGGGFFSLSNSWIRKDRKTHKNKKGGVTLIELIMVALIVIIFVNIIFATFTSGPGITSNNKQSNIPSSTQRDSRDW